MIYFNKVFKNVGDIFAANFDRVQYVCGFTWCTSIRWGEHKYAFVELNDGATSYNTLVKSVNSKVTVSISWDIWYGDKGNTAVLMFDNQLVKTATSEELKLQQIKYETDKPGNFDASISVCNNDGCSRSGSVKINIADTDGSHLSNIPYGWYENNVPFAKHTDKVTGAYFVEWGVYDRKFPADKVPIPNLTHLLYGFIPICGGDGINDSLKQVPGSFEALQKSCAGRDDFKVSIHDIYGALQKPQKGVSEYNEPYRGNFGQLMAIRKHNPHLKILPSIGGWTLSDPFYFFADDYKRKVFVDSVREFLQVWKFFDGVDIDWEFPGGKGANPDVGDPSVDGNTYVTLLKELRLMLDKLGVVNKRVYELTSAVGAGYDKIDVIDYSSASQYLDHVFLMSYDFKGAWSNTDLGHQTPLYAPSWNPDDKYTTDYAVKELLKQKVPSNKIVVGVAMYGRGWSGVHDYKNNNVFTGVATGPVKGTWENGVVDYRQVNDFKNSPAYTYAYDKVAEAPYVYGGSEEALDLISYDDTSSVLAKGDYVLQNNLGGLFAWEIDADNGDLLNAMNTGLGNSPTTNKVENEDFNFACGPVNFITNYNLG
ncbi:ORF103 [Xestia c-nigrum granulovirus]|uniref:ORF103 n=1 Tax=Xestia c-nigrum granulosis virus TaxID=51677 RepID=Q9PYU0_GVXN|nr:ORF103 [Xestia c-nigrum granulovirus]AAF05217.1 ORF103 [Xestia c-nigrum granulovirus]